MSWLITPQQKNKGLLDQFTGAAAAYSLRDLSLLRNAPVVRVRRSSDSTEADFTATEVSDGALAAWVNAGNNGFVRTWYDQSGNGLHLEQTTTANQPRIVVNGAVETEGGKPCVKYNNIGDRLNVPTSYTSSAHSVFKVCRVTNASGPARIVTITEEQAVLRKTFSGTGYQMYGAGMSITSSGTMPTTRILLTGIWLHTDGDMFAYSNGVNVLTHTTGAGATASPNGYTVGGQPSEALIGSVQEVIIYRSSQSSNRNSIESNINAHYGIY